MATPRVRNTENMKLKMYEVWEMLQKHFEKHGFSAPMFYHTKDCTRCAVGMLLSKENARELELQSFGGIRYTKILILFRETAKKKYADLPKDFLADIQVWHDCGEGRKVRLSERVEAYIDSYVYTEKDEQYGHLRK